MRHVITGGSGFVGSALTELLLNAGCEVVDFDLRPPTSLGREGLRYVRGDVVRPEDLAQLQLGPGDVVHHLAARQFSGGVPPRRTRSDWFDEVNVAGTRNVLAAMHEGGCRQITFFSTDMTYGVPTLSPVPPSHPQNPLGPYGRSKATAEALLRANADISATIFRPRLITGPGRLGILGKLFALIRAGLAVPLIGTGSNRYQMVSVDDCARAAILAVEAGCPPGPFNLGSTAPPTTRQLLTEIIAHARSRSSLLPCPAAPLKGILNALDVLGCPLIYPEQFLIADLDVVLDTFATTERLGWVASSDDTTMMKAAYDTFVAQSTKA